MTSPALNVFLDRCCVEIERRAALAPASPELADGARAFRSALGLAAPLDAPSATVPVVDQLDDLAPSPLISALREADTMFPWIRSHRLDDDGTQAALGRISAVCDFGDVDCGLLLIGANCEYPVHNHPPQELYLPIAGNGTWRFGGATTFRTLGDQELPYNNPFDVHSIRAGDEPLLAMYVLWP